MNQDSNQQPQHDCAGTTEPAGQPKAPPADPSTCATPAAGPATPVLKDPVPCPQVCNCPPQPGSNTSCIDKLIAAQTGAIAEAERAAKFKADLLALQEKIKTAQADYTLDKYQALLDIWKAQDARIAALIKKLVCAVKCWQCQTECQVCSLFNKVRDLSVRLNGTGKSYAEVDSLYDLQYWLQRDLARKQAAFDRVKKVLAAWENPAQAIEKVLNDNAELIRSAEQFLDPEAARLLYDVFIRLVPMHLAIAPPASVATTAIDKKYTALCGCDTPENKDDCCGPAFEVPALRLQLLGPQPYLLHPAQYFPMICCVVESQYRPAKDALAKTEGELKNVEAEIERIKGEIDARIKSIAKDAATELGKPFDCEGCKPIAKPTNPENHHA